MRSSHRLGFHLVLFIGNCGLLFGFWVVAVALSSSVTSLCIKFRRLGHGASSTWRTGTQPVVTKICVTQVLVMMSLGMLTHKMCCLHLLHILLCGTPFVCGRKSLCLFDLSLYVIQCVRHGDQSRLEFLLVLLHQPSLHILLLPPVSCVPELTFNFSTCVWCRT